MKQATAVVDRRTTPVCLHVAGQIRPVEEPFETLLGPQMEPPFHVHCRTIVGIWMPGFVNDQRREANAELQQRPLKQRRIGPGGQTGPLPPKAGPRTPPPTTGLPRPAALADETSWHAWLDTLPLRARSAVETYNGGAYRRMNQVLRGTETRAMWVKAEAQRIRALDAVFADDAYVLPAAVEVFRGVPKRRADDLVTGQRYVDEGYGSTTLDLSVAPEFTKGDGWVLRIRLDEGQRVLLGNARESELVLPRGMEYRVVDVDEDARTIVLEVESSG